MTELIYLTNPLKTPCVQQLCRSSAESHPVAGYFVLWSNPAVGTGSTCYLFVMGEPFLLEEPSTSLNWLARDPVTLRRNASFHVRSHRLTGWGFHRERGLSCFQVLLV